MSGWDGRRFPQHPDFLKRTGRFTLWRAVKYLPDVAVDWLVMGLIWVIAVALTVILTPVWLIGTALEKVLDRLMERRLERWKEEE